MAWDLAPKGIDVRQEDFTGVSGVLDDWFEDGELDGVEKLNLGRGDLKIVNFVNRQRVGFYLPNGKSFAVPEYMLEGKIAGALYQKLVKMFGVEESADKKTPLLIRSNVSLYKRLEQIGFTVVRPLLEKLSSSLSSGDSQVKQANMDFLIGYFFNEAIRTRGLYRVELKLNKNTKYYQDKAAKLAHLQDGVGQWDLVDLRYNVDGYTCCSLGHRIKWEFIVEERTTGETLSFGSTCIDDFFLVDSGVKNQIAKYKTYILNRLLEYAMQYDMGTMDNINIDRWVSAFGLYVRGYDREVDYHMEYIQEFVRRGMLIPLSLQGKYTEALTDSVTLSHIGTYIMSIHTKADLGDVVDILDKLVLLGYLGNLDEFKGSADYKIKGTNTDKLNLYGLKVEGSLDMTKLRSASNFILQDLKPSVYDKVLGIFNSCGTYDNYLTLLNNVIEVGESLPKTLARLGWFLKPSYLRDDKSLFGVDVTFDAGYKNTTVLVFAMNNQVLEDIFNVENELTFKLSVSKLPSEVDRNTIKVLTKLFSSKNLEMNFNTSVSVMNRPYRTTLEPLFKVARGKSIAGTTIDLGRVISGKYTGCLKESALREFLEEHLKVSLEDLEAQELERKRVEAAKVYHERGTLGNPYTNTVDDGWEQIDSEHKTEDGRWSPRQVRLEELSKEDFIKAAERALDDKRMSSLPIECLRLMQHFVVQGGEDGELRVLEKEFGYKVVKTCLERGMCSPKQLIYVKQFGQKLAKMLEGYYKTGDALVDSYLEVWFGYGR